MEYFTFRKIERDDAEMMEQIYRLRFQVYCRECGFIKEEDYPNGLEIDEYDKQSLHFAAFDSDGYVIGTMRMILSGDLPYPIETHCQGIHIDTQIIPDIKIAEISRLVISRSLRRRKNDAMFYEPEFEDRKVTDQNNQEFLRRAKPMAFGLYREMYQESKRTGITHWYSLMEKSLWLLLRLHGFAFEAIGDEVDVYGPVKPYLADVFNIEEEIYKKSPKTWEYFTENLNKEFLPAFSTSTLL